MENKSNFDKAMELADILEQQDRESGMIESQVLVQSSVRYEFISKLVTEGIL